ncbi:hypothetical protein G6F57_019653 [Rhizopus arrhizus]|nr:hypothetical protein G6F57_019653 [Rhizopus arrhizus]
MPTASAPRRVAGHGESRIREARERADRLPKGFAVPQDLYCGRRLRGHRACITAADGQAAQPLDFAVLDQIPLLPAKLVIVAVQHGRAVLAPVAHRLHVAQVDPLGILHQDADVPISCQARVCRIAVVRHAVRADPRHNAAVADTPVVGKPVLAPDAHAELLDGCRQRPRCVLVHQR